MSRHVNASFGPENVPSSPDRTLSMSSFFLLTHGVVRVASLFTLLAMAGPALLAQDTSGTGGGSASYQNAPVNAILDLYEQLSGKHLVRDSQLTGVPNMNLNANGLSKADTLKLITDDLLLNNVAIIALDDNTDKVITIGTNKNPRTEGIKIFTNLVDLPADDEIVGYYMPLNYISPAEAQGIFTQTAPVHTYGAYVPAPSAQAVVLTENTSVIRQLIALKELIDVPPAKVTTEFVQLNRADAEKVADTLNKMLGQGASGPGAAGAAAGPGVETVPSSVGNSEPLSNERNLISGSAQVFPVTRSNQLILITRPVNLPFLEKMIAQLDQPDTFMVPQRRPLKYVLAQDILPALEASLAQGKEEEDQVKKEQGTAGSNGSNQQGAASPSQSNTSVPAGNAGGGAGAGSVSAITPQLQTPTENDVPTVVTVGKTRILADNRSNSIIVFGSPDVVARVFDMVDQLDRKPLQVYLATVIGQLTLREGVEFGVDLLQKFQHGVGSSLITPFTGTTTATGATIPEPSSLNTSTAFPILSGLTIYGAIGNTLDAYVRALETTDRFKVISRPSVYTTNNKLAVIASGSQVPVPSSITSGFNGGTTPDDLTTTASVQYENVLLQLDIIPLINANHEVTLKIRQTNNSLGAENIISGNDVPTILTQEINTEVTVPDKSTVVIGGLISDSTTRDTGGVPFLSDIPILGYLFKDTAKTKERDELIIMISPTVVETDADQLSVNEAEKQRTILGREAVEAARGTTTTDITTTTVTPAPGPLTVTDSKDITVSHSPYNSKNGRQKTTTTTTTTVVVPTAPTAETPTGPSVVPILSSPAPDVSNGQMPKFVPTPGQTPEPGH
jgi:general secretion pathway protein D